MKNALKEKLASGQPALNGWLSIGNAFTAEIMAAQPYDSLTVDVQHGALDYAAALPMFQAMTASGRTLMARAPWLEPGIIMKLLDAGAMGIICPMINTPKEAAQLVSFMRYPPDGQRSFGPTRAMYAEPGYGAQANDHVLAFAMIETAEGMQNLDAILATPGLDGVYVGPADLTLGLKRGAYPPALDREEEDMVAAIRSIAEAARKHGKFAALHCGTPEYGARAITWGFHMVTVSGDTRLLSAAAADCVARFRALVGQDGGTSVTSGY